ncbi:MAG: hypothetical protein ACTS4T_01855 [Candidatus Hodgkinia cicadicola]
MGKFLKINVIQCTLRPGSNVNALLAKVNGVGGRRVVKETKLEVNMLNGASCGSWSNWHNIVMKCSLRELGN